MGLKESLRVMVVDDMATSRGLITQALDDIGVKNYITENDGKKALDRLSSNPVHLVLSDYNMPGLDGLGLLKAVRSSPPTQKIGFILVTGRPTPEIVNEAKRLGLNNMIKKPFTAASMKQCIESVVGRL
ncbi:Chemotaxis protein CheY [Pelagimonas phthalicica]|uniref:Chemotaxis protein CheY n=1 Tax=Pelagimonas phthalicica TaxID=1037362 RepID=A0A238JFJ1_9RHOB|nr:MULTISPECIES: response regulator [Roseobacteraceae]MBO9467395.1 response regulator [Tropicibacter sp. R15_0]TDS92093.1 response regulator receiver protein [Pelagimonas phthalicica]SMX29143.1 Chemotaxis protein CheY [Pelagimonas phthalicica]